MMTAVDDPEAAFARHRERPVAVVQRVAYPAERIRDHGVMVHQLRRSATRASLHGGSGAGSFTVAGATPTATAG